MRKWLIALLIAALAVAVMFPSASYTEDRATVRLAKTIYTLAGREDYDAKLAVGTVVMNRVEDAWFEDSLAAVLDDPMQFPSGERYDAESLRAAHEVLNGKRTLAKDVLYFQSADATRRWDETYRTDTVGGIDFYVRSGNI